MQLDRKFSLSLPTIQRDQMPLSNIFSASTSIYSILSYLLYKTVSVGRDSFYQRAALRAPADQGQTLAQFEEKEEGGSRNILWRSMIKRYKNAKTEAVRPNLRQPWPPRSSSSLRRGHLASEDTSSINCNLCKLCQWLHRYFSYFSFVSRGL